MQPVLFPKYYIIQIVDMNLPKPSSLLSIQLMLAGIWSIVCLFILAAPILASNSHYAAAAVFYFSFSCICHQIQERSFIVFGFPLAVCHRCFGIYLGLLLGAVFNCRFIHRSPQSRRGWVLIACMPLLLDFLAPYLGLWTGTHYSRFITGLLFGILISSLLVRGVFELLHEVFLQRPLTATPISKEAFHE
jgi:uncharacterized membrane protein